MAYSKYFDFSESECESIDALHTETPVVDGLIATDTYLTDPNYIGHLAEGGVNVANFTVASYQDNFVEATEKITKLRQTIQSLCAQIVTTPCDLTKTIEANDLSVILGFQDTRPIGDKLWRADVFAELGVRVVQLTYNEQNYVGSGCCAEHDSGLTPFGKSLITRLNELGILVDLSHCGDETTKDAIRYSSEPVALTHVGMRALCDAPGRNKTDEQLQLLADNGGVAGISFFPPIVKREPDSYLVAEASVEDVLDHVDYAVDLVGVEHVGIGTDLDDRSLDRGETPPTSSLRTYRPSYPEIYGAGPTDVYDPYPHGIHRHTELQTLTAGLIDRGYDPSEIKKILGGNFLRLFREVWGQ